MPDQRLIDILREVSARGPEELVCAYLFGSHARGDATPHLRRYRRDERGRAV